MNEDTRNLVLAVVLSVLVFVGWSFAQKRFFPPATVIAGGKTLAVVNPANTPTMPGGTTSPGNPIVPGAGPPVVAPAAALSRAAAIAQGPRVPIETLLVRGSINLTGARIDDLTLLKYDETVAKNSPKVVLLAPSGTATAAFAGFGFTGTGAPPPNAKWTASGTVLAPGKPVTLSYAAPGGVEYQIALSVADDYLFRVEQRVINHSAVAVTTRPYALVTRTGESPDKSGFTAFFGPTAIVDGHINHVKWSEVVEAPGQTVAYTGRGWLGFSEKYWLTALAPDPNALVAASFRHDGNQFQADTAAPALTAAPGATGAASSFLFAGAKEIGTLQRVRDKFGIAQFDNAIDWGWFYLIAKPIAQLLNWLFGVLGNFGLAIMALVLLLKLALFPIASRQFQSMQKMRLLQPKLKELQARHKEDKPRLQTEMMEFYKREKVNPVGGCLPTLIQIPIFFALYKTLLVTIEMRHQPLALWVRDLSSPDPLTPVNLFGLLPFTPPHQIAIGILPILLGVTMYVQQKQNPPSPDPAQQQIFAFMPWVFMFIMAPFAAGLQLYWATNNSLTILQQWWLKRRMAAPATAAVVTRK